MMRKGWLVGGRYLSEFHPLPLVLICEFLLERFG